MKQTYYIFLRPILLMVICLSLTFGLNQPVQAAPLPCTWEGDTNIDWFTPGNWDCEHIPTEVDTVVIPSGTVHQPTIDSIEISVTVNSIHIESGANLNINSGSGANADNWTIDGAVTANAGDSPISINYLPTGGGVMNVNASGKITKLGSDNLFIYAAFNNAGTVTGIDLGTYAGGIFLKRGGTHTGIFQGEYLFLGDNDTASGQVFNFNSGSHIRVNQLHAMNGTVNILGSFSPPNNTGTNLFIQPQSGTSIVHIKTGASILKMAELTSISYGGKLILETQDYNYYMPKLNLEYAGEIQNADDLTISTQFLWKAGKIAGNGTTTIENPAVFTMGTSVYSQNDFTLDNQTLINNSTANWTQRNLALSNSAEFVNNGTFNANATTTMSGGETVTFTNNGEFYKNSTGTTTTMNVNFANDGLVQVNAGSLVFPLGMQNGDDTTINLNNGTLNLGETLTLDSGDSLVGSGTLAANLINGGTVGPGESPGLITVEGDYDQQAAGVLKIELGGTTAGADYDQLVVTGRATMYGTLIVAILPGFTPQEGDTFYIIYHDIGTGTFDTVSLPTLDGGLEMKIDFSDEGVTLTVVESNTFSTYLPLIVK